jgi:transcriptional regulator with XRE-family HTH domain
LTAETDALGARVRSWRLHLGLSQSEIERRAGLAHNALSRIETGEVAPRLATLERIADALDVSIEQLQFRSPPATQPSLVSEPHAPWTVELNEMIHALPKDRRDEVVDLLIQIVRNVRP